MDIIDKFCNYFCKNNLNDFLSIFTDDACYIDCLYGLFQGKDEIAKFYNKCHIEAENYIFKPYNKFFKSENVAFEWDFSFKLLTPLSNGAIVNVKGASFISLENSKIKYYRDYSDSILFLLKGNVPPEKIIKFYKNKYREYK